MKYLRRVICAIVAIASAYFLFFVGKVMVLSIVERMQNVDSAWDIILTLLIIGIMVYAFQFALAFLGGICMAIFK